MRSRNTLRLSLLVLSALFVATCSDRAPPTAPATTPTFDISDAAHGGPNLHFYFLPPLVPQPSYEGDFDATLSPTVTILEDGVPFATLTVSLGDEFYHVNWHTDQYVLDHDKTYRITVGVDGSELGFADVVVADNVGQLKNVNTDEDVTLKDGRTLPIKFRIEDGAVQLPPVVFVVTETIAVADATDVLVNSPGGDDD